MQIPGLGSVVKDSGLGWYVSAPIPVPVLGRTPRRDREPERSASSRTRPPIIDTSPLRAPLSELHSTAVEAMRRRYVYAYQHPHRSNDWRPYHRTELIDIKLCGDRGPSGSKWHSPARVGAGLAPSGVSWYLRCC